MRPENPLHTQVCEAFIRKQIRKTEFTVCFKKEFTDFHEKGKFGKNK